PYLWMENTGRSLDILVCGKAQILATFHRIIQALADIILQNQQAIGLRDGCKIAAIHLHNGFRQIRNEARHIHRAKHPVRKSIAVEQNCARTFISEGDRVSVQLLDKRIKCAFYLWIVGVAELTGSTTLKECIESML